MVLALLALFAHRFKFRRDPQGGRGGGDGRDRLDHAPTREERWRGELAATERKKSGPKGPRLHSGGGDGRDRLDMRRQGKRDGEVNSPLQNGRRAALKDRVYTAAVGTGGTG